MAMADVDGNSHLLVDSQPKSVGLVWGLAATRCSVCIHQMNRVTSSNAFGHDDTTINRSVFIIINAIADWLASTLQQYQATHGTGMLRYYRDLNGFGTAKEAS